MKTILYSLLNWPVVYKLSQLFFAPGGEVRLIRALNDLTEMLPKSDCLLDVGCGPSSWLWHLKRYPVGLDLSPAYTSAFHAKGQIAVTGSAFHLPFADQSFDGVWCIGVLHHLQDSDAGRTVKEMMRVCRPGGYVVIMDAVLPKKTWKRPVASLGRKMDRGNYMRKQEELEALLAESSTCCIKRYTYTYTGLEMLECVYFPV